MSYNTLSLIRSGNAGLILGNNTGTVLPLAAMGLPVGMVSPNWFFITYPYGLFVALCLMSLLSSTGICCRFSGTG